MPAPRSPTTAALARSRKRYSSVLESALVGLGREGGVVKSARKPRRKRQYAALDDDTSSPISSFTGHCEPSTGLQTAHDEEEDPFALLKLEKKHKQSHKKRKKLSEQTGVLEKLIRTPVTRSMAKKKKKKRKKLNRETDPEEEVVVQKRLFQSPEPKKTFKEGKDDWEETSAVQSHSTDRVYRKAVVLEKWSVVWPLALVSAESGSSDAGRVQLVLIGLIHGTSECFIVAKREGPRKFTSSEGEYVSLSGPFDEEAAKSAGMPTKAMELMRDGIPSYFQKKLLQFVEGAQKSTKRSNAKPTKKKQNTSKKDCSDGKRKSNPGSAPQTPLTNISNIAPVSSPAPFTPGQGDVFETPKSKKRPRSPKAAKAKAKKKSKITEPEDEEDIWSREQLQALADAKLEIPTTASNFWAQVAQFVPGKTANDCQKKTFEQFKSPPTNRNPAKKVAKQPPSEAKIARAGSNKFKKQVREFVEEYEKKHVDDLFDTTPSKEGLPELPDFDALKSPELGTPSRSFDQDDSDLEDDAPGLLKKLSSRNRDDIDSYVLGINRQHVAGGGVMKGGKVRRLTAMSTPVSASKAKTMSAKKKAVLLEEECGSHFLKGVISPGGTARVRVEKDGSSSEDEEDDGHSSDEEQDCDIF